MLDVNQKWTVAPEVWPPLKCTCTPNRRFGAQD